MQPDDVTLAVIGDIHAHFERLGRVLARIAVSEAAGILLVGDLAVDPVGRVLARWTGGGARYHRSVDDVLGRTRALGLPVLYVPGNHDLPDLEPEGNVDGRVATIAGVRVAGIGGAGPGRFGFPYEWSEADVRARDVPECDVLLCHAPPARTAIDALARRGRHVGSEALRELAERHDGVYVCGHIHESPGAVELGRALCLNAGGLGEPYGKAQVGFVRRSPDIAGGWQVVHEDLESGLVRSWSRT